MTRMYLLLACTPSEDTLDPERGDTSGEAPPDAVLAAFEDQLDELGAPGVAVGIWQDGRIVHAFGLGRRGPETDEEVGPDTLFRIGSVTKMLTASALLEQVDAGALDLETPLSDLVDVETMSPEEYQQVTVHHLLSHQGGFWDHTPIEGTSNDERLEKYTEGTWASSYSLQMVEPGAFWNYSNPNFALAGLVIERADGQRYYREALREDVLTPLGMDRTLFLGEDVIADGDYATGKAYDWTGGGADWLPSEPDSYDHAWSRPAGFAFSSVSDLLRFASFLMEEERLVQPHVDLQVGYPGWFSYGYGVMVYRGFGGVSGFIEEPLWTHGGAIPGFSAELFVLPERDFAVAVLSNGDGAYFGDAVAVTFDELVEDLPAGGAWPDAGTRDDMSRYAGTYYDAWNIGEVIIKELDGSLQILCPTLADYGYEVDGELVPLGQDNFVMTLDGTGITIALLEGPDFDSQYLRHRAFVAHRQDGARSRPSPEPDVAAILRAEASVPQSQLPE